jgi:hypothetical protein
LISCGYGVITACDGASPGAYGAAASEFGKLSGMELPQKCRSSSEMLVQLEILLFADWRSDGKSNDLSVG